MKIDTNQTMCDLNQPFLDEDWYISRVRESYQHVNKQAQNKVMYDSEECDSIQQWYDSRNHESYQNAWNTP